VSVAPYAGLPRLYFAHNAAALEPHGNWYYGLEYAAEKERGLDSTEDLYNPFTLRFSGTRKATIIASTLNHSFADAVEMRKRELRRRKQMVSAELRREPLTACLTAGADQFIVDRGDLKSIVAGYHWFGDWGRDTMIALPGLTLVTGRLDVAKNVLLAFAACVNQGMLPNRFPDDGEAPEYNTADATLWFFEAIHLVLSAFCPKPLEVAMKQVFLNLSSEDRTNEDDASRCLPDCPRVALPNQTVARNQHRVAIGDRLTHDEPIKEVGRPCHLQGFQHNRGERPLAQRDAERGIERGHY
jgi:hypothetical protein